MNCSICGLPKGNIVGSVLPQCLCGWQKPNPPVTQRETWTPVEIGVDVTKEGTHVVGMYVLMPEVVRYVFYSQFHPAPQRTWVGLTDEEVNNAIKEKNITPLFTYRMIARTIETKLKERNI
jgi:hypothetical protein